MNNKEFTLKALTELFINGNIAAVDTYWAEDYKQHNPGVPNGNGGLKHLIASFPPGSTYEIGTMAEEGDKIFVHGRYVTAGKSYVAVDIYRIKDGKFTEHWDIIQEEVPAGKTASGNPMFPIED
jgi:predicted SnoaL-like aldol condensation-catalyzing enzyme